MKIKELFEEVQNPIIKLCYEFSCHTSVTVKLNQYKKQITGEINTKAGSGCFSTIDISSNGNSFVVYLTIPDRELESIHLYVHNVISILGQYLDMGQGVRENDDDHRCEIYFHGDFPKLSQPISFPAIYLIPSNKATLTNVAKSIGECNWLEVGDCNKIVGNVLGLVKLSKKMPVTLTFKGNFPDWVAIVNRHLTGNKDVLACQEELMDAGFNEYAKL